MNGRKQRRISRSAALYIPVSVLIIGLLTVFGISVFMKILEIEVVGASTYSQAEVIEASGITSGDNLLFIDSDAASQRIYTEMPFVRDVKITRVPPSAVLIEVAESTALAVITYKDGALMIDSECRILEKMDKVPDIPDGSIEITGLSSPDAPVEGRPLKAELGNENQLQYLRDVLVAIEKEGMQKDVAYIDVANTSKINFGYLGTFRVILGNPSNIRHKLSQLPGFVAEIRAKSSADAKGEIDMSDQSGEYRFNPKN
jgi:cell division protein FtsQ